MRGFEKIDVHHGLGSFIDKNTINIEAADGKSSQITAEKVIIATGSKPASLPFINIDKKNNEIVEIHLFKVINVLKVMKF